MGWMKDILNGVGDVADFATPDFITDPLMEAGGNVIRPWTDGVGLGDPFRSIFAVADTPRLLSTSLIGEANYQTAGLRNLIGITSDSELEEIRRAHEEGGSRGVWEDAIVDDLSWWQRGLLDIAVDPLTVAGGVATKFGKVGGIMDALGNTSGARRGAVRGIEKTARALNAPDRYIDRGVANLAGGIKNSKVGAGLSRIGQTGPFKSTREKFSDLLQYSDHVKLKLQMDKGSDLVNMMLLGRHQFDSMRGMLDAQYPVPVAPDFGHMDSAARNMQNLDPAASRHLQRPIRQQVMNQLGDPPMLENQSVKAWGLRNSKRKRDLIFKDKMGGSMLDTTVPRSDRGLDTADPFTLPRPEGSASPAPRPEGPIEPFSDPAVTDGLKAMDDRKWSDMAGNAAYTIDDKLADMNEFGGSWRLDPSGNLVELPYDDTARRGYPVALTSAGKTGVLVPGSVDTKMEIAKALKEYRPILESDPDFFIGAYRMEGDAYKNGEYSFDLNIHAHNEEEADLIAAMANQQSWFDPIAGDSIVSKAGLRNSDSPFKDVESLQNFKAAIDESRTGLVTLPEALERRGIANPLKARDIHEELGFSSQKASRDMRERKVNEFREKSGSVNRSRILTDLDDQEWADMATKIDTDINDFAQEGVVADAFDIDPDVGIVEIPEPRGFRVNVSKVGTYTSGQSAGQVKKAVEEYRRVLQEPDIYLSVERLGNGKYDLNISIDALSRDEAQVIAAVSNSSHFLDPEDSRNMGKASVFHGAQNNDSPFKTASDLEDLVNAVEDARLGQGSILENLKPAFGDEVSGAAFAPEPVGPQPNDLGEVVEPTRDFESINFRRTDETREEFTKRTLRELNERVRGVGLRGTVDDYVAGMKRGPSDIEVRKADGYFLEDRIEPLKDLPNETYGLDAEQYDALFGVELKDGTSIGHFALHTEDQLLADLELFKKAGITWGMEDAAKANKDVLPNFADSIKRNLTEDEQKYIVKRVKNWDKLGIYPEASTVDSATKVVRGRMLEDAGLTPEHHGKMARMRSIWSAVTLTSPRYVIGNLVTNVTDSIIAGHFRFDAYADVWKIARAEMARGEITDFLPGSKLEEYAKDVWGFTSDYTIHNRTQRNLTGAALRGDSEITKLAKQLKIERLGIHKVVDATQAMAQALDTVARGSMAIDVMDSVRWREMPQLMGKLEGIIEKSGIDMMGRQVLPKMDPAYIRSYYRGLGVPDGLAQRAEREVATVRNMARKEAQKEVERVALSYRRTKLDDKIANFIPFHYWASRKFRWYAEEAYRNPVLLANYGRAIQGLENSADDPGLSARQKGFLKLFGGPAGFTLLMNPDAMLGVIRASQLNDTYQTDGETELGGVLNWLSNHSVQLYPWIQGAANMIGMQGDTFEPDMIGIRHRGIIGAIVNYARGEGWLGESNRNPGAAPYAHLNMQAREKVSGWVSSFTPDWLSQKVVARDKSIMEASIETTIESRIIAENPDLTNAELIALMNDPDSPEYQSAFQDAARAGVIGQGLSFTVPISFKAKENTKDVRNAAYGEVKKAAERVGISPYEFSEKDADAEFRAAYKNKTGKEFTLDDFNKSEFEKSLVNAANPTARNFILFDLEYRSIGEGRAKKLNEEYWNLKDGTDPRTMYLPEDQRDDYAKSWAERSGAMEPLKEMWDMQRAYKQSHPMYGAYKEWQSQMGQLQRMSGGSLAEYRRVLMLQNPSAANYFRAQEMRLIEAGIAPEDIGAEMDRITMNPSAWFAINGMPQRNSDPAAGNVGAGDPMFGQISPLMNTSYTEPVVAPSSTNGAQWNEALAKRGF